ncbi:cytochrome c-type biogenesis protein [Acidisoma silvae]|uniref:Cytochrome c-type biogenesis protein n=1 Tax=Acidisoma silvae TaxID=2802396 RepID=A0A963YN24_9PROT|nr:cytochrome c-type biogenesis protein [Acidisoma silvae]MCB8873911.1 cytochrome c-type biogenesis protein CcmH [Acidisoma silvae]
MRRLCFAAGLAILLLQVAPAFAVSDPSELLANPALEARAEAIGSHLRCLVCQNESIEASDAGLAKDIRAIIRQQVVAGRSDKQITAYMVQRYGTFILLRPPFEPLTVLLWGSPVIALLLGAAIAFFAFRRQRREAAASAPIPLSPDEQAKLEALLRS